MIRNCSPAQGDVVEFKGYNNREQHLAIVGHGPEQKTVELDRSLWNEPLNPHTRLVLQRDDPHRAISIVPAVHEQSRFEVAIDKIQTRLSDLAGVAGTATRLLEDIALRICHPELRPIPARPAAGHHAVLQTGHGQDRLHACHRVVAPRTQQRLEL